MKAHLAPFLLVLLALGHATAQQLVETAADGALATEPPATGDAATTGEDQPLTEFPAAGETEAAAEETQPATVEEVVEESPSAPTPGLAVRVERLQGGGGTIDPAQVKLLAPFPAKLLAQVPAGWRIERAAHAPSFTREVEIAPGSSITLSVKPHLLVPDANGESVFTVPEPGYNAALGYRQDATVGAILATSIHQLDEDARQLGAAIDQLQQLLVSLPQPQPAPAADPKPARQP